MHVPTILWLFCFKLANVSKQILSVIEKISMFYLYEGNSFSSHRAISRLNTAYRKSEKALLPVESDV